MRLRVCLLLVALGTGLSGPRAAEPFQATQAPEAGVTRLRTLVEAAEKALQLEDRKTAGTRAEEADVLVADWSEALLRRADVAALLERLKTVLADLESDMDPKDQDGLKAKEEIVALTGEDLRAELARVSAAEQGASYDFPIDLNDKVLTWVHLFTTSKRGFMEGSLSRGTRYLPMIRQIFAEEGVPQDLAFLAVPESGFTNKARSRAKAVGMWQFIRSTGRIFGLNTTAWVDERRDPVKAARAAARYLKRLCETRGDWYLALAGYNSGPLTVDRAVTALGTRNYWDLCRSRYLRNETKNYIPELCATILIGHNPEKYGLNVPQMPPYAYETVEVDRMTSLAVLARHAGTDVASLKELNTELLRESTPPGKYGLRVPAGTGLAMMRALADIPSSQRLDFKAYQVRKGDTLAKVAARFKVSAEDLLATNNLEKADFRVGRRLKVPPPPATPVDARDLVPSAERNRVLAERPLDALPAIPGRREGEASSRVEAPVVQPPAAPPVAKLAESAPVALPSAQRPLVDPPPAAPKSAAARPAAAKVHVVRSGETLFAVATQHGVSVKDLQKWNRLRTSRIGIGQKLRLQAP
jgi:membrane-bound lytic murein transglycosylase D